MAGRSALYTRKLLLWGIIGAVCALVIYLLAFHERAPAKPDSRPQAAAAVEGTGGIPDKSAGEEGAKRPNFWVVMVDDQAMSTFRKRTQPFAYRLFSKKRGGTMFTDGWATPPLCCPARATFQTGQYPHNHGVLINDYGLLRDRSNVISTWLQEAGYATGFVGKYMNDYEPVMGSSPAPGYDYWWAMHGKPGYWDYKVSVNGEVRNFGSGERNYSTNMITERSIAYLKGLEDRHVPFFLWTSYYAPHIVKETETAPRCRRNRKAAPLRRDWRRTRQIPLRQNRTFNERYFRDKPKEMRSRYPKLDRSMNRLLKERQDCALAAMMPVDRGMQRIWRYLRHEDLDRDTVIIYLSDNGYFYGEHRIPHGKGIPYVDGMRVPLAARVPKQILGARARARVTEPTALIDIAPTIVALAGATSCHEQHCRVMDGRSLVPLLRPGASPGWAKRRQLLFEVGSPPECERTYASLLSGSDLLTQWYGPGSGKSCRETEREYYDLAQDPSQMRNRLGNIVPALRALKRRRHGSFRVQRRSKKIRRRALRHLRKSHLAGALKDLQGCSGVRGRDRRQRGRPFCS